MEAATNHAAIQLKYYHFFFSQWKNKHLAEVLILPKLSLLDEMLVKIVTDFTTEHYIKEKYVSMTQSLLILPLMFVEVFLKFVYAFEL